MTIFRPTRLFCASSTLSFDPKEISIDLFGTNQVLQLLEPCKGTVLKNFRRHIDFLEQLVKLFCPPLCVPGTLEARQMLSDFFKRNPVTAVVRTGSPERKPAAGESFCNHLRNFLNSIIVCRVADIKDLVMHRFPRGFQNR